MYFENKYYISNKDIQFVGTNIDTEFIKKITTSFPMNDERLHSSGHGHVISFKDEP
jgi:hypothetical protein